MYNSELLGKNKALEKAVNDLQKKLSDTAQTYKNIDADRENLMAQLKRLLQEKTETTNAKEQLDGLTQENTKIQDENELLKQQNAAHRSDIEKLKGHIKGILAEQSQMEVQLVNTQAERNTIVEEATQKTASQLKSLHEKVNSLTKENHEMTKALKAAQKENKTLGKNMTEFKERAAVLHDQLDELEESYTILQKENRHLADQSQEFPKHITDLARQNKRLIEQTADMHYNQGVFYSKNKEFKRAIKEFEKVLDVKPKDPQANYNLGYIYAEHLLDRPKAIAYFKDYLTYAPDATDADWVRNYIMTWQTWYGNEPIK
jgi:chromosome segregation ATPase